MIAGLFDWVMWCGQEERGWGQGRTHGLLVHVANVCCCLCFMPRCCPCAAAVQGPWMCLCKRGSARRQQGGRPASRTLTKRLLC